MIQCEKCSVWQHAECVGVKEATVPDEYFCELCMPEHEIHRERRRLLALMKSGKKGKGKKRTQERLAGAFKKTRRTLQKEEDYETPKRKKVREVPTSPSISQDKPMSREERKLKQILETIKKLEGGETTKRARSSGDSTPTPTTPQPNNAPSSDAQATPRSTPVKTASTLRSGRTRSGQPPRPAKRTKRTSTPKMGAQPSKASKPRSRERKKVTPKQPAVMSRFERRRVCPLTPMYMGKKAWLVKCVQENKQSQEKEQGGAEGFKAHVSSFEIPMTKRVLGAYIAEGVLQGKLYNLI